MHYYLIILIFIFQACTVAKPRPVEQTVEECVHFPNEGTFAYGQLKTSDFSKAYLHTRLHDRDCYRKWKSDKYLAMDALKERLDGQNLKKLQKFMGQADTILDARLLDQDVRIRDQVFQKAVPAIKDHPELSYHIYFWRDWHDYLYFIVEKELIKKAEWYMAFE